jgi:hypothetical protein
MHVASSNGPRHSQTGCGKTHTMEGREQPAEERGIIPRAFDHIFRDIQKGGCWAASGNR